MTSALLESKIPGLPVRRGKVRDVYELDADKLLIVASDRISAFDVIMPTPIPDKGRILTQLSNFWFGLFSREFPGFQHHLLATDPADFPRNLQEHADQLAGRSVVVLKTKVLPIECVVRGYITGSGWKDYQATGVVSGIKLPPGLRQCDALPEPIFTPSTKAEAGHDMPISFDEAAVLVGGDLMAKARELTIALYKRAAAYARTRGIIVADTKFEFGTRPDIGGGLEPILIDEALTPDSSRFWPADQYAPGRDQPSFDKQYLRNYLETLQWNKTPPGPVLPADVVANTRLKYAEAYERLTARKFPVES
ncbi:MAG TPA: phosphoribosylaminoimidazolesuccinocarboxamide synthase [Phycisphaerae bacterium]|nr:phosphoribosylaminoimidazolesuccinocarboxamide synthase [Phycisphaerae bacterium]